MRIVTFVKYVPDAAGDPEFLDDNTVDRESDGLLSELDEYPVELALTLAEEADDAEVIALTVGPDDAVDAVRKALQMGADSGVHIVDDAIAGSDALATAKVLAAAVKKVEEEEGPVDLILTGFASTDGNTSVVPTQVAELLGLPAATVVSAAELDGQTIKARRDGDSSSRTIEVQLPALVSVTDQTNDPRYPSFKGIMAAKKKPVEVLTLADANVEAGQVGKDNAASTVTSSAPKPPRAAGEKVVDEGEGGNDIAKYLVSQKLI